MRFSRSRSCAGRACPSVAIMHNAQRCTSYVMSGICASHLYNMVALSGFASERFCRSTAPKTAMFCASTEYDHWFCDHGAPANKRDFKPACSFIQNGIQAPCWRPVSQPSSHASHVCHQPVKGPFRFLLILGWCSLSIRWTILSRSCVLYSDLSVVIMLS